MVAREIVQRHGPIGRGANSLQKVERPVANTATNAVHSRLCRIGLAGNLGFSLAGQSDVCVELHEAEYTLAVYFRQAVFSLNYAESILFNRFNDLWKPVFDRGCGTK